MTSVSSSSSSEGGETAPTPNPAAKGRATVERELKAGVAATQEVEGIAATQEVEGVEGAGMKMTGPTGITSNKGQHPQQQHRRLGTTAGSAAVHQRAADNNRAMR